MNPRGSPIRYLGSVALSAAFSLSCSESTLEDRVQDAFETPTGSVTGAAALREVVQARSHAGPGLAIGGVQGSVGASGAALTFDDVSDTARSVALGRARNIDGIVVQAVQQWQESRTGLGRSGLGALDAEICPDFDSFGTALAAAIASGDGEIDITIADLSQCTLGLTGSIRIVASISVGLTSLGLTLEETLSDVCSEGSCVNGTFSAQYDAGLSGLEALTTWDLTAVPLNEAAVRTTGGIRLTGSLTSLEVEYLFFVSSGGEEASFVATFTASGEGLRFEIRGADGTVVCMVDATGAGRCSGDATVEWAGG